MRRIMTAVFAACAMLVAQGGGIGRIALFLNAAAILFISDIPLAVLALFTNRMHLTTDGLTGKAEVILLARPIPLVLLALSAFGAFVMGSAIHWLSNLSDQPKQPPKREIRDRAAESYKPL